MAEIATAGVVALALLFLAPVISLMPEATLGALVLMAAAGLIKVSDFQAIGQVSRHALVWALVAFAGVVLVGTLQGILVAVVVSMLDIIYQANRAPVYEVGRKPGTDIFRPVTDHPDDETLPGLLLLRTEGRLYFGNSPRVWKKAGAMILQRQPQVVVLDCSAIPDIEYTALQQLTEGEEKLREAGITLWLAALNPAPLHTIERSSLGATLGHERMYFNLEQAIEAYLRRGDQGTANG
jgi:MFS superfamily sulfate permease-like transporter